MGVRPWGGRCGPGGGGEGSSSAYQGWEPPSTAEVSKEGLEEPGPNESMYVKSGSKMGVSQNDVERELGGKGKAKSPPTMPLIPLGV